MDDLDRLQAMASPGGFAEVASRGRWQCAPHLRWIDDHLALLPRRIHTRLLVTLPPRHGKSELVSRHLPAWWLGRHPDDSVILTSYEYDFAASWAAKARDLLVEHGREVFGVDVERGERAPSSGWTIKGHRGICHAAGVGGPITGKGACLAIIDDPVKNAEQAYSLTHRGKAWDWYRSTLYSRLEPDGIVVLMLTRWHEDDLAGRLLEEAEKGTGDRWTVLSLPALADGPDPLGRAEGEALWPERYPRDVLEERRRVVGPYWWEALYQQRPSTPEGAIFRRSTFRYWWRHGTQFMVEFADGLTKAYDIDACRQIMTVDTAMQAKEQNDRTAILAAWVTPDGRLLVDDIQAVRLEVPDQWPAIKRMYQQRRPAFLGIEDRASGIGLIQQAKREGIIAQALRADTDKIARARPAAEAYAAERIAHRKSATWLEDAEEELANFPVGAHDDIVDAIAYAWLVAQGRQGRIVLGAPEERERVQAAPAKSAAGILVDWRGNAPERERTREWNFRK